MGSRELSELYIERRGINNEDDLKINFINCEDKLNVRFRD
jgi:hypothetical protein